MERKSDNGREVELADGQQGCVTREQLGALGFGAGRVESWLRSARLHPIHRGVYLLGHRAEPPFAQEMAAVLACCDRAVLSHRSAVHLWWGSQDDPRPTPIEVTVRSRTARRHKGVRVHRTRSLAPDEVATRHDVPITSPARTIVDFAAEASDDELEWALGCAQRNGAATRGHLLALLARRPRLPGRRGSAPSSATARFRSRARAPSAGSAGY